MRPDGNSVWTVSKRGRPLRRTTGDRILIHRKRRPDQSFVAWFQGSKSSIWLCLWPFTIAVSGLVNQTCRSTACIFQVPISEAMTAPVPGIVACKGACLRFRAMRWIVRSTGLLSSFRHDRRT